MATPKATTTRHLTPHQARGLSKVLIAPFAHEDRFAILTFIVNAGRPVTHAEIIAAIGISPSSLTQHLNVMSRFIVQTRQGRSKVCEANLGGIGSVALLWIGLHDQIRDARLASTGDAPDPAVTLRT